MARSHRKLWLAASAGLGMVVLPAFSALGQTWTATADGNWNTAANWNGGAGPVPTSGTSTQLTFDAAGSTSYTATNDLGVFTLNRVTFNNSGVPRSSKTLMKTRAAPAR